MRIERVDEIRSMVQQATEFASGKSATFEDLLGAASAAGGPLLNIPNDPMADLVIQSRSQLDGNVSGTSGAEPSSGQTQISHLPGQTIDLSDYTSTSLISDDWMQALPVKGQQWAAEIETAAERYGLDPRLLASLVWSESAFNPTVTSHAGAIGLAQLMPATAEGLGVNPWDPVQNLDGGARFLKDQIDRFGSIELALAAYNAGPARVASAGAIPNIPETQAYVRVVMDRYTHLGGNQ